MITLCSSYACCENFVHDVLIMWQTRHVLPPPCPYLHRGCRSRFRMCFFFNNSCCKCVYSSVAVFSPHPLPPRGCQRFPPSLFHGSCISDLTAGLLADLPESHHSFSNQSFCCAVLHTGEEPMELGKHMYIRHYYYYTPAHVS